MRIQTIHRNKMGDVLNECSAQGFQITTADGGRITVMVDGDGLARAEPPSAPAAARGEVVAWFPTNAQGEIIRNYGDGSPVYAYRTKEEAEQAKRCHLGATGPVIPLYAAPPPAADCTCPHQDAREPDHDVACPARLAQQPAAVEGFDEWYDSVDARFWDNRDACNAAFHAGKRAALAQQPAPSALVGAEDIEVLKRLREALHDAPMNGWWLGVEVLDRVITALTQHQEPKP